MAIGLGSNTHHLSGKLMPEYDVGRIGLMTTESMKSPGILTDKVSQVTAADSASIHLD
jgi:hypothetical protein